MFCVASCPFWCCGHLDGGRGLVALLGLSSWCLVVVGQLFLAVPRCCLQFVIVVFPDHTHYFLGLNNKCLQMAKALDAQLRLSHTLGDCESQS